tara:strand:- start:185 stop:424 length:240 start_codon:yes stop_codon:yes gene_type:complete
MPPLLDRCPRPVRVELEEILVHPVPKHIGRNLRLRPLVGTPKLEILVLLPHLPLPRHENLLNKTGAKIISKIEKNTINT